MNEKYYSEIDRKDAQYDILGISTDDNSNFPKIGLPHIRHSLSIKNVSGQSLDIIRALNHLDSIITSIQTDSNDNLQRQFEMIGDFLDTPSLKTDLEKIDENLLKSVYKLYKMMVGPGTPHDISLIANNIHQAINIIYDKIKHIDEDSNGNMLWKGSPIDLKYTNEEGTPISVGGIQIGSTFQDKSINEMFDMILYPELNPSLSNPSVIFEIDKNEYQEIGSIINLTFVATFNRGNISPAYGTSGYRSGLPNSYNYTGLGLSNSYTSNLIDTKTYSGFLVPNTTTTWICNVSYSGGEQPLTSKGNNYNIPLSSGMTNNKTVRITGVYPYFATTNDISVMTKQPLTAMNNNYVEIELVAESGINKQSVEFPLLWDEIIGIQFYNTINGQWEWLSGNMTNSLTSFTITIIDKEINGSMISYKKYIHNGSTIGNRILRFYSN